MHIPATIGRAALATAVLLAGCDARPLPSPTTGPGQPTIGPSGLASAPPSIRSAEPSPEPGPTATPLERFPLAVVTGVRTRRAVIDLPELAALAADGRLVLPCGITVDQPPLAPGGQCIPANQVAETIEGSQATVALLPPGLVEPATRVLPIRGDGPLGLFGPDLFGDAQSRALPYPISGLATGDVVIDPAWLRYDPAEVWTLTNVGSLCSDRNAAHQAVTLGKGWYWVFNGGTAEYRRPPRLNPNPPPGIAQNLFVEPRQTGNSGVVAELQRRADVAIGDHECPIVPDADWQPNLFSGLLFSVPEAVVPEWRDTLGIDVVYLAANHMSDKGAGGIRSTLRLLDRHGLPGTGLGRNLNEALEPAFVDVAGIRVGFVAFNDVGGVIEADADTPGVAWLTQVNVSEAVRRARDGGARLVVCTPQWWGGLEYHDDLLSKQVRQLGWFEELGCDHVVGSGTHVAGPMLLRRLGDGVSVVLASPGNYVFGQDFFQDLQEGVILELAFAGTRLVNVRLHPYVIILGARPALTDPLGDGRYVLERIFEACDPYDDGPRCSDLDYLP